MRCGSTRWATPRCSGPDSTCRPRLSRPSRSLTFVGDLRRVPGAQAGRFDELIGGRILINRQWVQLPVEPVLKLVALGLALVIAVAWRQHDVELDHVRAVLARAARQRDARSDLRPAAGLLPVYAAGLAAHRRLAADPERDRLPDRRRCLCWRPRARAGVVERGFGAAQIRLWRGLSICRRGAAAGTGAARLPGSLRAAVPGPHHLRRCDLHRRARHPDRHADRRAWRCWSGAAIAVVLRHCGTRGRAGCWPRPRRPRCATCWSVWSAGTSAASSSSRTSWCASGPSSRTTSR